ncbi:MAG: hypothetical protein ACRC1H_13650, partial [Caldilineaceae bacterium]
AATLPENIRQESFQILPVEAQDWVAESGIPQPPSTEGVAAEEALVAFDPDASITTPTLNGYIGKVVEIKGSARGGPHKLEIGRGLEPTEWTQIGSERGDEVVNGVLQTLDTVPLGEGVFTLRLTVNRPDGARTWLTPVTIDN